MNSRRHDAIVKRFNEDEQVDRLIREAVRKAVEKHFSNGERVVVWRDGKPVWVDAEGLEPSD